MKVFFATLVVLVLAFGSIMAMQSSGKTAKQEDMTQFNKDFETYMETYVTKEMDIPKGIADISAKCKPNQGADHPRCWVTIGTTLGDTVEKVTAENVRRRGDKFVWDHES